MPHLFRPRLLLTAVVALALSLPAGAQRADVRLPSLGSSAATVMSPQEAEQYGAQVLRELRGAGLVLDDPLVDEYLNTLGYRLAAASSDPGRRYTFTLIDVPQINAFATFGGYVFIFSGMLTATRSQDELAAVMAHELAHISQDHLQRAIEDQQKAMPLYVLGALGAALAASRMESGRQGGAPTAPYGYGYGNNTPYDPGRVDASTAALVSVMALMQQHQIEFTRKDEAEADHVGIETLANAGFKPEAMADFFAHMQSLLRPGGDGGMAAGNLPDFLQDHPGTSERIADARARARSLEQQMPVVKGCVSVQMGTRHCTEQQVGAQAGSTAVTPPGLVPLPFVKPGASLVGDPTQGPSTLQYQLMRERVRVLASENPRSTLDYYTRNMAGSGKFAANVANRYGHALALVQLGRAAKAAPIMAELSHADPGNLTLALGLADAERRAGQRSEALQRYASLNTRWPNDAAVVLDYSRALLDDGSAASAKVAQGLLKPLLNDDSEPSLYSAYGHACHVAGDEIHAGIAYADATFLSGHAADSLDQLHRLLDRKDLDYYSRAQIDSRIAQITPIVLEIRRRHLDRDDRYGNQWQQSPAQQTGLHFRTCAGDRCVQR